MQQSGEQIEMDYSKVFYAAGWKLKTKQKKLVRRKKTGLKKKIKNHEPVNFDLDFNHLKEQKDITLDLRKIRDKIQCIQCVFNYEKFS